MKTFSVAVAVAVVLTFICIQESSAVPLTEDQELEVPVSIFDAAAAAEETSADTWKTLYHSRQKRSAKCRFCCGCCGMSGCGVCCPF